MNAATETDPYKLAEAGCVRYMGDRDPLSRDGTWYSDTEWERNGYADAVRVTCMPEGPDCTWARAVVVELLTINKPSADGLRRALESCGVACGQPSPAIVEIEACSSYGHYDPNDSDPHEPQTRHYVIVDHADKLADADRASIDEYCRIHGARVIEEEQVWLLLWRLVAVFSCNP